MTDVVMYPYKSLVDVNTEVHNQLLAVIESFVDENLAVKVKNYDRGIGMIIAHTLNTLQSYFIKHLALGEALSENYKEEEILTVAEAKLRIKDSLSQTENLIFNFPVEKMKEEIQTEWGTTMSREMAIWQGIIQVMLHLGEITLLAGMEGFYTGVLG